MILMEQHLIKDSICACVCMCMRVVALQVKGMFVQRVAFYTLLNLLNITADYPICLTF